MLGDFKNILNNIHFGSSEASNDKLKEITYNFFGQKIKVYVKPIKGDIKYFYEYTRCVKSVLKLTIELATLVEKSKDKEIEKLPRNYRRQARKEANKDNNKKYIKETEFVKDMVDRFGNIIEGNGDYLKTTEEFCYLIFTNVLYEGENCKRVLLEKTFNIYYNAPVYFIVEAKKNGVKCDFLDCFDDDGTLIVEKAQYLKAILRDNYRLITSCNLYFEQVTEEAFIANILSEKSIREAEFIMRKKARAKRINDEKIRDTKRLEREKATQPVNKVYSIKNDDRAMDELARKVINPSKQCLKKDIEKTITIDELKEILDGIENITEAEKEKYLSEYNQLVYNNRMKYLLKITSKSDSEKLKSIIIHEQENAEIMDELDAIINDDNFDNYTDEELNEKISVLLNEKYLKEANMIQNYVVFANNDLVNEEIDRIYSLETMEKKQTIIKSLQTHLLNLEYINYNDLKSKSDLFHELLRNQQEYTLDGKLKGYRFGAAKSKVALFNISVHAYNQKILHETYKIDIGAKVFLVFGLCNVMAENEFDGIERMMKYGIQNKDRITHISEIFANPFTESTLNEARQLIDSGIITIQNMGGFSDKKMSKDVQFKKRK